MTSFRCQDIVCLICFLLYLSVFHKLSIFNISSNKNHLRKRTLRQTASYKQSAKKYIYWWINYMKPPSFLVHCTVEDGLHFFLAMKESRCALGLDPNQRQKKAQDRIKLCLQVLTVVFIEWATTITKPFPLCNRHTKPTGATSSPLLGPCIKWNPTSKQSYFQPQCNHGWRFWPNFDPLGLLTSFTIQWRVLFQVLHNKCNDWEEKYYWMNSLLF